MCLAAMFYPDRWGARALTRSPIALKWYPSWATGAEGAADDSRLGNGEYIEGKEGQGKVDVPLVFEADRFPCLFH